MPAELLTTLAYTPFADPISEWSQGAVVAWWATLPLLALGTALAYKAVRLRDLRGYWKSVGVMTLQISVAMLAIGVLIGIVAEVIVPFFGA